MIRANGLEQRHAVTLALALALSLTLACGLSACGSGSESGADAKADTPSAAVSSVLAAEGALAPTARVYALITSAVSHTHTIVMPHEGVISAVMVHDGDSVPAGQAIVTIALAPAAATQYAQASSALTLAEADVARVQRLQAEKLATNDQLAAARKALSDAQQQSAALKVTGADRTAYTLRAPLAGVVSGLTVVPGDRPAVGAVLALVGSRSDVVAQLGVEPADAVQLRVGATVRLKPLDGGAIILARLGSVGAAVDATTRLVKAVASIPVTESARLTLGTTLVAEVDLPARKGIVVPRGALLEDAAGPYVYTMEKGIARRQSVAVGAETEAQALLAMGVTPGSRIIVENNAALSDGTAVEERPPSAEHPP